MLLISIGLTGALSAQIKKGIALSKDRTGLVWVAPFSDAVIIAQKKQRLLMIKPIAFGTDKSGCWWPAGEVLRVGPFCDPQVVMLANRRFVPFAFDLNKNGGIADSLARKVVIAAEPKYSGKAISTPDVLFMTSQGKLLGRVSNYASEPFALS